MRAERIVIIGPSNIGDAVLAADVVAAVRRARPEAHLTLVVGARAHALFAGDPRIQTLVDTDAFASPGGRVRLAWALWRHRPHHVVDLRHTLYPWLLAPHRAWRYVRQPPARLAHMRERHRWKLRAQAPALARSLEDGGGPLWTAAKDRAHVEQLASRWALSPAQPLVVICPGARSHIKRWTAEGFARVAERLMAEGHAVVFSGEPAEEPVVEEILGLMARPAYNAVGLLTVRQAAALMARAALVITNDSASLHVASALGRPVVAIFGPTDAAKYGPTSPRARVLRRQLFCSPCEQPQCRFNHECMRFISPDDVYAAARELLAAAP
jgi:heptosyltransferase-2